MLLLQSQQDADAEDAENMTILFQTYSLKDPNKTYFVRIFCVSANFRVLIRNIRIVFSNS